MINSEYISQLVIRSKSELKKHYNLEDIGFDDFEIINFYLINKTLNQDKYNLAINVPQRNDKRDFYIPVILSVATTLFFQNYIDDKTKYKNGDILQKDGKRYRYDKNNLDGTHTLSGNGCTLPSVKDKSLKKYIVTTANLTDRQVKTKFNHYKNLFKLIFGEDYVPSKFTYKTAIILEKKDFLETLNNEKILEIELKKAIPFKWVTKKGIEKDESDFIPIEPMIYLLPDYETFKELVFDEIENLDSVIFIGKNKYEPFITQIKRDLRKGNIPKAIFIGSNNIESFDNLKTWKWTQTETNYFNNIEDSSIELITVKPENFLNNIENFEKRISEIDNEYCFNIKTLFRLKKILYSTVLPSKSLRLASQLEYINHIYEKEIKSIVSESFLEINENPEKIINELTGLAKEIINSISTEKFNRLIQLEKTDILIVPERFKDTWQEDLNSKEFVSTFGKTKLLSFKEFKQQNGKFKSRKNISILTIFGFSDIPTDILRIISQTSNNFSFVLYPEENQLVEKLLNKCQNESIQEFGSTERYSLSKIEYPIVEKDEDISDIILKFYEKESFENKSYHYEYSENVEYEITSIDGEKTILEGSKTILLSKDNLKRKEKVSNLIIGDKIRIYENTSKERLFQIATENDKKGKLIEIIETSKIWKQCLKNYFIKKESTNFGFEELLAELVVNGAKIQIITLKKWLSLEDKDLFPSQTLNLIAIKKTIDCDVFNNSFDDIKRCKKAYRSIMIALGRDLSDEIMDYIISDQKVIGKILAQFNEEQIAKFIDASAPLQTIEKIQILENCEHE